MWKYLLKLRYTIWYKVKDVMIKYKRKWKDLFEEMIWIGIDVGRVGVV